MAKRRLDPTDKAIIHYLGNVGDSNINEISKEIDASWGATRSHLKKLRKMGYIRSYKSGEGFLWTLEN